MSEKTITASIKRAIKTARTKRDEDGKRIDRYYGESRFRLPEYDRRNRNIFAVAVVVCVVCAVLWLAVLSPGSSPWWFAFAGFMVALAVVVVWCVMDRKWREDYTIEDDMICPGSTYKYSIMGGRALDPYVDAERKLRKCLLHCSNKDVNDRHVAYKCTEIDGSHIVFTFLVHDCYGFYGALQGESRTMSAEFGDPDGADFAKTGEGSYELIFDRGSSGSDPMAAGVAYAEA